MASSKGPKIFTHLGYAKEAEERVAEAMLQMVKLDIAALQKAYDS